MSSDVVAIALIAMASALVVLAVMWQACGLDEIVTNALIVVAIVLIVGSIFFMSAPAYLQEVDAGTRSVPREMLD